MPAVTYGALFHKHVRHDAAGSHAQIALAIGYNYRLYDHSFRGNDRLQNLCATASIFADSPLRSRKGHCRTVRCHDADASGKDGDTQQTIPQLLHRQLSFSLRPLEADLFVVPIIDQTASYASLLHKFCHSYCTE